MVFVPMAQAPPKAGAKLLYNLNMIHEFTSWFSPKMIYAGLPCLCGYQCFSALAQATAKIRPRPAQGNFRLKELHRTTKPYSQMNPD